MQGITLLSLPGKVHSRMLEKKVRLMVKPQIQREPCIFYLSHGSLDQLLTLFRILSKWGPFRMIEFLSAAREQRESRLVASGFHHCFLQSMWSCWYHCVVIFSSHWSCPQSEKVDWHLWVGDKVLPQVEFKCLGVLFRSEGTIWGRRILVQLLRFCQIYTSLF